MADFRPGGLMTASVWPHAHSTVSCRHNACFLAYPAQMGFAESACITVSISLYKETHLEIISPDEKGQPFSTVSVLSYHTRTEVILQAVFVRGLHLPAKKERPVGRSFFWLFAEQNEFDLAVRGIRLTEHEQLQRAAREINPFGTVQ